MHVVNIIKLVAIVHVVLLYCLLQSCMNYIDGIDQVAGIILMLLVPVVSALFYESAARFESLRSINIMVHHDQNFPDTPVIHTARW